MGIFLFASLFLFPFNYYLARNFLFISYPSLVMPSFLLPLLSIYQKAFTPSFLKKPYTSLKWLLFSSLFPHLSSSVFSIDLFYKNRLHHFASFPPASTKRHPFFRCPSIDYFLFPSTIFCIASIDQVPYFLTFLKSLQLVL